MKKQLTTKSIFVHPFLLILVIIFNSSFATSQEIEDEHEFDYSVGSGQGPDTWGKLRKEWGVCNNGKMQSPIDLLNERVQVRRKLGKLKRDYKSSNATLRNRGHDIMLEWKDGAGSLKINGSRYTLLQCHWHSHSEHTVDGKRYALEMHLVHLAENLSLANPIAVVGILYNIGHPEPFLAEMEKHLHGIIDSNEAVNVGTVDPRHVKMGGKKYYRYMGSLTIPPCTEGVIWIINKRVRTVSEEQVSLLRKAVHDYAELNARPLQPQHNRDVHLIDPTISSR